jgi:hypothetical protein
MMKIKKIAALLAVVLTAFAVVSLLSGMKKEKSPAVIAGGTCVCLIIKMISAVNKLADALSGFTRSIFITATEIVAGSLLRAGLDIKAAKKAE